jgi:MoxR-like ATPase
MASEREILRNAEANRTETIRSVLSAEELVQIQSFVARVVVEDSIVDYMLAIVEKSRAHESLSLGVSPRGAQALYRAAQALALVEGRDYVIPDDVKRLAVPVFAHRVLVNSRVALANRSADWADRTLQEILTLIDVPL